MKPSLLKLNRIARLSSSYLIKQLFDFINHKESDQHQRFKKLYSLLVDLKIQAIEQIIAGQGPELTDILAYQCPLFTVLECQRVRDQVQDDAEKWLTGKTKDQSKARGKQRQNQRPKQGARQATLGFFSGS